MNKINFSHNSLTTNELQLASGHTPLSCCNSVSYVANEATNIEANNHKADSKGVDYSASDKVSVFSHVFCVFYILVAEITLVHFQTQVPPSMPL